MTSDTVNFGLVPCLALVFTASCMAPQSQSFRAGDTSPFEPNPVPVELGGANGSRSTSMDLVGDLSAGAGLADAAGEPGELTSEALLASSPASVPLRAKGDDEWTYHITPYVWFMSLDGTAEVDGTVSTIDESFSDIWDQLNFVVEGRFEAWKGNWGAMLDLTYAELENEAYLGPVEADVEMDMSLVFAGGLYRFVNQDVQEDGSGGVKVDALFGVAYTALDSTLEAPGGDLTGDEGWFDPIFGVRARWSFSDSWGGSVETILGGFELFDGAETVNMTTAVMRRNFGSNKALYFGWRTLDIDYDDEIALNVNFNGPLVGFRWSF